MQIERRNLIAILIAATTFVVLTAALIGVSVSLSQRTAELAQHLDRETSSSLAPSEPPSPFPVTSRRLPTTIRPSHYELFLQINLPYDERDVTIADPFTTKCSHVAITLRAVGAATNSITLHARTFTAAQSNTRSGSGHVRQFTRDQVTLTKIQVAADSEGTALSVSKIEVASLEFGGADTDMVVLHLASEMPANQDYVLRIEFEGVIADDNTGLYRGRYTTNGTTR